MSQTAVSLTSTLAEQLGIDSAFISIKTLTPVYAMVTTTSGGSGRQLAYINVVRSYTISFAVNVVALSYSPYFSTTLGNINPLSTAGITLLSNQLIVTTNAVKSRVLEDMSTVPLILFELGVVNAAGLSVSGLTVSLNVSPTASPSSSVTANRVIGSSPSVAALASWFVPVIASVGTLVVIILISSFVWWIRRHGVSSLALHRGPDEKSEQIDDILSYQNPSSAGGVTIRTRDDVSNLDDSLSFRNPNGAINDVIVSPGSGIGGGGGAGGLNMMSSMRSSPLFDSYANRLALADIQPTTTVTANSFAQHWNSRHFD
jgi:hypothetical protein